MNFDFFFHLKMNDKNSDDLIIWERTYIVDVHIFGEIGASSDLSGILLHKVLFQSE